MREELIFEKRIKRFLRRDLVIRIWVDWETRAYRGEQVYE
jgi:hypothetical protein